MGRGATAGERRWRTQDGKYLLTWDSLHGEIEIYDKIGRHRGVMHALTGELIKQPIPGRQIDV